MDENDFKKALNPDNWSEETWLHSRTFKARLLPDGTLYLQGPALQEGFSPSEAQALTQFLSERIKLPPKEPPYDFGDFHPTPVDL